MRHSLIIAAVVAALAFPSSAQIEKVKTLFVDGQNNHDFMATTAELAASLRKTGRFDLRVSTSPRKKADESAWKKWRPPFAWADVVISNYNGQAWPKPVRKAFLDFVKGGGGLVLVHAANNSFRGWQEYERLTGLCWRPANWGCRIVVDDATGQLIRMEKGQGRSAGHGRQHRFLVKVRNPDHPIMRGLPRTWLHAKDELYHGQRGPAENMTVLSSAYSNPKTGGTGKHEPITWFIPYGKGRVITTVLGHHWRGQKDFDALHCVGFQTIVARAAEWAATGVVTLGIPNEFPSHDRTSVTKPEKLTWPAPRSAAQRR